MTHHPFMTSPTADRSQYAKFVTIPGTVANASQKVLFRKTFHIDTRPDALTIHVTADQLYKLYVNEQKVGFGPAIGSFYDWQYDTYDIAPFLREGENILAAEVYNFGELSHGRWITERHAFLLQADKPYSDVLNTGESWKAWHDKSWQPIDNGMIAGPQDRVVAAMTPWGWKGLEFADREWMQAEELWGCPAHPGLNAPFCAPWKLVPRRIPFLECKPERIGRVRQMENATAELSADAVCIQVPADTEAAILLDNEVLTIGFVNLITSGGKDARIEIQYAEALYDSDGCKGNRDEVQGKAMQGYVDVIVADGGDSRHFLTSWLRTYRFVKVTIKTSDEAITIDDFYTEYAAYPFEHTARFRTENKQLSRIYDVGWRTARLCAIDTYTDCPYYEQLQYIGDTRIQALVSYYVTGDARLARNALLQFDASRQYFGLLRSSYPSTGTMIIPPFSLFWILMIDDYVLHTGDMAFVKQFLPGIQATLNWFEGALDERGLPAGLKYWNFVDWNEEYVDGVVPDSFDGVSTPVAMLLAHTLEKAASLMEIAGNEYFQARYYDRAQLMKAAIYEACYDTDKKLFGDTPDKELFTEYTNAWAIIAGVGPEDVRGAIAERILSEDSALVKASLYGRFYVNEALRLQGKGGYVERLTPWIRFVDSGLTTFPEHHRVPVRSDCHAWSASPVYELYRTVAGVQCVKAAFSEVVIKPDLAGVGNLEVRIPSPHGFIEAKYEKNDSSLSVRISIPPHIDATFVFGDQAYELTQGDNELSIECRPWTDG